MNTALRKLERVAQEMRERRVNNGKSVSPTLIAWADRITSIIAALGEGQEAGAVAWEYRERGSDAPWVRGEGSINAQYNAEYWEVRRLYDHPPVSTGQTSDARDAARSEAYDKVDRFLRNTLMDAAYAEYSDALEIACGYQDAAMRQEAGDD